ncbi:MAG TPA: NUDIX hydrolase [Phototrophicaceae bacterium]|nr:NUDIX hydrolase [Phototrophicaceae bacterium]
MIISKWRIAAAINRFPFAASLIHSLWRLTRPHFTAGVIGVLINPLGEVLVVEHVYHTPPRWGLPGGYVERGEDPAASLARELHEELELSVEVGAVLVVERGYGNHLDIAYACHPQSDVGKLCNELLDYRWSQPDQLPELRPFHRKAISQAFALTGIQV